CRTVGRGRHGGAGRAVNRRGGACGDGDGTCGGAACDLRFHRPGPGGVGVRLLALALALTLAPLLLALAAGVAGALVTAVGLDLFLARLTAGVFAHRLRRRSGLRLRCRLLLALTRCLFLGRVLATVMAIATLLVAAV